MKKILMYTIVIFLSFFLIITNIFASSFSGEDKVSVSCPKEYYSYIKEASDKYDVPAALIDAIIFHESRFQPGVTSSAGAMGLMQLMPATGQNFGYTDLYDPKSNIMAGTAYLHYLFERYGYNSSSKDQSAFEKCLSAYGMGEGNTDKGRMNYKWIREFSGLYELNLVNGIDISGNDLSNDNENDINEKENNKDESDTGNETEPKNNTNSVGRKKNKKVPNDTPGSNVTGCGLISGDFLKFLQWAFDVIKVVGPIMALLLGMIDFIKATASGEDDAKKKAIKDVKNRLIAAFLLFLIPAILQFALNLANGLIPGLDNNNVTCGIK